VLSNLVSGQEKFFVTLLGALQALLAADVFPLDPAVKTGLIGLIVPMIAWLTANTKPKPVPVPAEKV
jgi:hypothetical protein